MPRYRCRYAPVRFNVTCCRYNRLYTVTGQCKESQLQEYKGTLQSVLQTFAPPALPPY